MLFAFLAAGEICKKREMRLRRVNEGIYIISRGRAAVTYRICEANISHCRKAIYRRKETKMGENSIKELSIALTVELTELCDKIHAKTIYTNQLLRSCSSIGANAHEATYAHSRADFISKMEISLKECYETEYWLEVLFRVHSLSEEQYKAVSEKCGTIRRKLIASVTTAKKNT